MDRSFFQENILRVADSPETYGARRVNGAEGADLAPEVGIESAVGQGCNEQQASIGEVYFNIDGVLFALATASHTRSIHSDDSA